MLCSRHAGLLGGELRAVGGEPAEERRDQRQKRAHEIDQLEHNPLLLLPLEPGGRERRVGGARLSKSPGARSAPV
jgi:hypothetical protein